MKNDIDAQFLCKDCDRYSQCRYYHNRKEDSYICKYFEFNLAVPDKESCENTISRQAALDIINERECHEEYCGNHYEGKCSSVCITIALANKIADLPSATPIRPKGEWKCDHKIAYFQDRYVCSECGSEQYFTRDTITNFCPDCGADMRGEAE